MSIHGFGVEHVQKELLETFPVSAPYNFTIFGIKDDGRTDLLDRFSFDAYGTANERYSLAKATESFYSFVKLQINSNWGEPAFTCLYRFRVFGEPREQP